MRIPENVKRGVAYLDENEPGWRDRVDPYVLDMANGWRCIIGQLDCGYDVGLEKRDLSNQEAEALGFSRLLGRQTWENLTAAWRKVLSA